MSEPVRVTQPLLDVLEVLLNALRDDVEVHGWVIMKESRRTGPTVYGVLDRLEKAGWVAGRWEDLPQDANRPRRRLYRITPAGRNSAVALLAERRPTSSILRHPSLRPGLAPGAIDRLRPFAGGAE